MRLLLNTDLGAGYIGGEEEERPVPVGPSCIDSILLTTTTTITLAWPGYYLLQQSLVLLRDV